MPRLRRIDCSEPGLSRRRAGRGFCYRDPEGRRIDDPATLERIRALAIPPAWRDVWIAPDPYGHLQATGIDAAGRKQYLYHPQWRARRERQKFAAMVRFARALPALRAQVEAQLGDGGGRITRERALACAVRLLDRGCFRIGGEQYAESNGSFGLATLRKEHVTVRRDGTLVFDYPAKHGQRALQEIADPQLLAVVTTLRRRRGGGPELLAYRERGAWRDLRSDDINAYLQELAGEDVTAKSFRTWNATVLATVALAAAGAASTKTARLRAIRSCVEQVAAQLGNTPAVCRSSYIDPRVFDAYRAGELRPARFCEATDREAIEAAVLDLLEDD